MKSIAQRWLGSVAAGWTWRAAAILDRVLHHAVTVNIRGNSYRLKDKLKSGIVQAATEAVS